MLNSKNRFEFFKFAGVGHRCGCAHSILAVCVGTLCDFNYSHFQVLQYPGDCPLLHSIDHSSSDFPSSISGNSFNLLQA